MNVVTLVVISATVTLLATVALVSRALFGF